MKPERNEIRVQINIVESGNESEENDGSMEERLRVDFAATWASVVVPRGIAFQCHPCSAWDNEKTRRRQHLGEIAWCRFTHNDDVVVGDRDDCRRCAFLQVRIHRWFRSRSAGPWVRSPTDANYRINVAVIRVPSMSSAHRSNRFTCPSLHHLSPYNRSRSRGLL